MNVENHDNLHKEIDIIQDCINRMAQNSFMIKGWLVTLVVAMLILMPENIDFILVGIISLIPLISFWYLNAVFLQTEKKFRKLYEWVIVERLKGNHEFLYGLDTERFNKEVSPVIKIMFSKTLLPVYGVITIIIVAAVIIRLLR